MKKMVLGLALATLNCLVNAQFLSGVSGSHSAIVTDKSSNTSVTPTSRSLTDTESLGVAASESLSSWSVPFGNVVTQSDGETANISDSYSSTSTSAVYSFDATSTASLNTSYPTQNVPTTFSATSTGQNSDTFSFTTTSSALFGFSYNDLFSFTGAGGGNGASGYSYQLLMSNGTPVISKQTYLTDSDSGSHTVNALLAANTSYVFSISETADARVTSQASGFYSSALGGYNGSLSGTLSFSQPAPEPLTLTLGVVGVGVAIRRKLLM